jgi:hypothetical protein
MGTTPPIDAKRFELAVTMSSREALDRLASRVRPERPLALLTGDWIDGYVGSVRTEGFNFRRATNIPRLYAVQAFGSVVDEGLGSVVRIRFRRNGFATALVWFMRILTLLLVAGALLAALRQPAFLAFGAFAAVGGGAIIWNARERESDRRRLREFVLNAFRDSLLEPVAAQSTGPMSRPQKTRTRGDGGNRTRDEGFADRWLGSGAESRNTEEIR